MMGKEGGFHQPAKGAIPVLTAEPRLSLDVERGLFELAEQRMLIPARKAGYDLRLVGATVLPQRQTITRTQWGTWLFVDHAEDPTAGEYRERIPIPEAQLARLRALDRVGTRPQFAWVGHELPNGYREGDPVPRLVPPPRHLREKDERLRLRLAQATKLFLRGIAGTLAIAAATPIAAAGAVAGLAGLDPIIFGGVKHPQHPVVAWCVLAQWEWE